MVQINFSAFILLVTAITSSFAYPVNADAVELQEREPIRIGGAVKLLRHVHRPNRHQVLRGARGAARAADFASQFSQPNSRELNDEVIEVVTREPRRPLGGRRMNLRKWFHRKSGHRQAPPTPPAEDSGSVGARELSDEDLELIAREPFFGFHHLKHWLGGKSHHHHHFQNGGQLSAVPNNPPMEAPAAREYEDLLEREDFDDLD